MANNSNNSFTRETYRRVFFVFLGVFLGMCVAISFICMFFPIHTLAFPSGSESYGSDTGVSGDCRWRYETTPEGDTVLTIAPDPDKGGEGKLDLFSWNDSKEKKAITTRVVVEGRVKPTPMMDSMFQDFERVQSVDLSGLDMTGVQSMKSMFAGCKSLASLDVGTWDLSNVTSIQGLFDGCGNLSSLDVKNWNVSNVTEMENAFRGCHVLGFSRGAFDVSRWNVSKVEKMDGMFHGCLGLASLGVGDWKVSSVTSMKQMFHGCSALTSLPVNDWDVSHVTDMSGMFASCSSLASLDLSKWSAARLSGQSASDAPDAEHGPSQVKMTGMFSGTSHLGDITLGETFCIEDDAGFESAGSEVGTYWRQVAAVQGGTVKVPKGAPFTSGKDLIEFHRDRAKRETGVEQYVRLAEGLLVIFDKGSDDARGVMHPQSFSYNEKKPLTANNYEREGYEFHGWRDTAGRFYADKEIIGGSSGGKDLREILTAQWKPKTYTVTFEASISAEKPPSLVSGPFIIKHGGVVHMPPSSVVKREGYRLLEWTSQTDGGLVVRRQPGDKLEPVTSDMVFNARWESLDHAADGRAKTTDAGKDVEVAQTFEEGIAAEEGDLDEEDDLDEEADFDEGGPGEAADEAGAAAGDAADETGAAAGDAADETGAAAGEAGETDAAAGAVVGGAGVATGEAAGAGGEAIGAATGPSTGAPADAPADTSADAPTSAPADAPTGETQENTVVFTYLSEDTEKGTVSRSSEEFLANTGAPGGCSALPKDGHKFVKWTKNTDSSWSSAEVILTKGILELAAKKDGKFVSTTFTAHFAPEHPNNAAHAEAPYPSDHNVAAVSQASDGASSEAGSASSSVLSQRSGETQPGSANDDVTSQGSDETQSESDNDDASREGAGQNATTPEADTAATQNKEIPKTGDNTVSGDDTVSMLLGVLLFGPVASVVGLVGIAGVISIVAAILFRCCLERRRKAKSSAATLKRN